MTRLIMFVIVTVFSIFSLFGCGATLHQTEPRSGGFAHVEDESPVVAETHRRERTMVAETGSVAAACDSDRVGYRARLRGGVSTRDGMRVYCF